MYETRNMRNEGSESGATHCGESERFTRHRKASCAMAYLVV